MRHMAWFVVSSDLIRDALAMPTEAKIFNIVRHDWQPNLFVFYVEHPDLPEVLEGMPLIEIMPIFKANYDKQPSTWIEFDFNLPKDDVEQG